MKRAAFVISLAIVLNLLASGDALARPKKGFFTGPYLALNVGTLQSDFDTDQVSGENVGNDFEPTFGFIFGWNLWDALSTELQGRYATNPLADRRLHIASAIVYGKWSIIFDALTKWKNCKILPFLKGGAGLRASILPSNRNASSQTVVQLGYGPSVGAGISFLCWKYFYFGFDVQGDLFVYDDIKQTVGSTPNALVYKGGFHPSLGLQTFIGVHY